MTGAEPGGQGPTLGQSEGASTMCRVCGVPLSEAIAAIGVCHECVLLSRQAKVVIPPPRYGGYGGNDE